MIHPFAITNEQTPTGNVTWARPRYSQMTRGVIQSTGKRQMLTQESRQHSEMIGFYPSSWAYRDSDRSRKQG